MVTDATSEQTISAVEALARVAAGLALEGVRVSLMLGPDDDD
jgi:hypothetical protein